MNVIVPTNQYSSQAYLYADATLSLGELSKQADNVILMTIDYRQVTPPLVIDSCAFQVDIGSNPPLMISSSDLNSAGNILTFILSEGVPGTTYKLSIVSTYQVSQKRTDVLTVDVPTKEQCATVGSIVNQGPFANADATIYVNTAPKYFVSGVTPPAPSIMDLWYDTGNGVLSQYITDGQQKRWWQELGYLPAQPTLSAFSTNKMSPITPDGTTITFPLTVLAGGATPDIKVSSDLQVSVDGVVQEPDVDYTASQGAVTFAFAPFASSKIFMVWTQHI
jgi:hypothetical protein